jgi:hypothetical protein
MSNLEILLDHLEKLSPHDVHFVIAPPFLEDPVGLSIPRGELLEIGKLLVARLEEAGITGDDLLPAMKKALRGLLMVFAPHQMGHVAALMHLLMERHDGDPEEMRTYRYAALVYDRDRTMLGCHVDRNQFVTQTSPSFIGRTERLITQEDWMNGTYPKTEKVH